MLRSVCSRLALVATKRHSLQATVAGSVDAHVDPHVVHGDEYRLQQGRLSEVVEESLAHPAWPCQEEQ